MSAATTTLSRFRVAFRKPKPPSPRRIVAFMIVVVSLGFIAKVAFRFAESQGTSGRVDSVLLIVIWTVIFATSRREYLKIKKVEERTGLPVRPSGFAFWFDVVWVCMMSIFLALPPW